MNKKISIFDVDGTLSEGFYIIKFAAALHEEGLFVQDELRMINACFSRYKKDANYQYEQFAWDLVNAFGRGCKRQKSKRG